jgi:glucosyl-dolichyl phosphate glucuronosyltransferase
VISVVVATRDRAALLASTLDALCAQVVPDCPFEIVVVDNNSVDDTRNVVTAAAQQATVPIVYVTEGRPGKSHALNTAIRIARGQVLAFTDDDVLPAPGWLAAFMRAFRETGADYAAGRILPLWEAPPPRWLTPALHGVIAVPDGGTQRLRLTGIHDAVMPIGTNMAVRRQTIDRIGGWHPELGKLKNTLRTGEDHEFALRMNAAGFTGVYEPEASVLHRVSADRLRLSYFSSWCYGNGAIEAGLEQAYPSTTHYLFGVPRYLWRRVAKDIWNTLGGLFTANVGTATAGAMSVVWFMGYLRGRWKGGQRRPPTPVRPQLNPGSWQC